MTSVKRTKALSELRDLTGLPLAEGDTPRSNARAMHWTYGDPVTYHVSVKEYFTFGARKLFKGLEVVLAEDAGANKLMLRLSPRHKEPLAAFLIRNGGVDLREPVPIAVEEITMRLQRVVCGADDPA